MLHTKKNQVDIQSQKKLCHASTQVLFIRMTQNDIYTPFDLCVGCPRNTASPELPTLFYRTFGRFPTMSFICTSRGMGITSLAGGDCDGDTVSCRFDGRLSSFLKDTAEAVACLPPKDVEVTPNPAPKWVVQRAEQILYRHPTS